MTSASVAMSSGSEQRNGRQDASEPLAQKAMRLRIPFLTEFPAKIDEAAIGKLISSDAARLGVIPIALNGRCLTVATSTPGNLELEQTLSLLTGCEIEFVAAVPETIDAALRNTGTASKTLKDVSQEFQLALVRETESGATEMLTLRDDGDAHAPIVRLVSSMLKAALEKRASDIHIHAEPSGVQIHFRIDGVLKHALGPFELGYHAPLISRIKVMAELDIAERRIPQDGRFKLRAGGGDVDCRVSVLPGANGEDVVIRILDKTHLLSGSNALSLNELGFDQQDARQLEAAVRQPFGMVLVTGPTGSGKTTTLYACLSGIDASKEKIISIEDPVEYELPGILQIPVNEKKNLTFARGLRSILRHDPDRIMVGEIRDTETASIAIQAALTGHLVVSTLHANNAFDVIARFSHMRIDLYELTTALNCIVAQRLLRKLCARCKQPVKVETREIEELFTDCHITDEIEVYEPVGCDKCFQTGYHGRTVAVELLELTPDMRQLIVDRRSFRDLQNTAREAGMRSMRDAAVKAALAGVTSFAEVLRVT